MKVKTTLFLAAIAAAGMFALPAVLATFAGSHTMEAPTSGGRSLDCTKCHQYIQTELNATTMAGKTYDAHKTAAGDLGYLYYMYYGKQGSLNTTAANGRSISTISNGSVSHTGPTFTDKDPVVGYQSGALYVFDTTDKNLYKISATWNTFIYNSPGDYPRYYRDTPVVSGAFAVQKNRSLDLNNNGIEDRELCKLCHWSGYFGVEGTHTGMTVVGCTSSSCHGNAQVPGKTYDWFWQYNSATDAKHFGAGWQLSRGQEAHSNFYYAMNSTPSTYVTADGRTVARQNLTADYYTCLACHTHVGMKLSIKRPAAYDIIMNKSGVTMADYKNDSGAWLESLEINHTATNFGTDSSGTIVGNASLNTSNITIVKDPTSAWINDIPGKENKWQNK